MASDLAPIQDTLAGLTDAELHALIEASNKPPPVAYGLLVWIEGACDWELNRRAGQDYDLQPPKAAIDPSEDQVSLDAAYAMRDTFPVAISRPACCTFFDALNRVAHGRPAEALDMGVLSFLGPHGWPTTPNTVDITVIVSIT
jgi:hypothetical protein